MKTILLFVTLWFGLSFGCDEAKTHALPRDDERSLFGKVVSADDSGAVEGAKVSVSAYMIDEVQAGGALSGHIRWRSPMSWDVWSDSQGRFIATLPEGYQYLMVDSIVHNNDTWLWDYAWTAPLANMELIDNRRYTFRGATEMKFVYVGDPDRMAVFPLYGGIGGVQVLPSKGGRSIVGLDKVIVHEPTSIFIPTAGPGAAESEQDRTDRLDSLDLAAVDAVIPLE